MSNVSEEERFARNALIMAQAVKECIVNLYDGGYKTVHPDVVTITVGVISSFDKGKSVV